MRTAPAAYWGAWAETVGYGHVRQPRLASACVQALEGGGAGRPALCAAHAAANLLRSEGWRECPTWAELLSTSCAAPCAREAGPGDWPHGWQFHASRTRSLYFRDRVLLPTLEPAHQALLLAQSSPQAAAWLTAIPTDRTVWPWQDDLSQEGPRFPCRQRESDRKVKWCLPAVLEDDVQESPAKRRKVDNEV
eukprot:s9518_g1.t1